MSGKTLEAAREDILLAIRLLWDAGGAYELRIPKSGRLGTVSGYYNDPEAFLRDAAAWSGRANGVYMTLNPVKPELLARAANHLRERADTTTGDSGIKARHWIPLDFDPVREAGISSSDAEHEAAIDRAKDVGRWLLRAGCPQNSVILADSGNGAHLLVRVSLENTAEDATLVLRCIQAVALRFSDDAVAVDVKTGNASRIWKVYGTAACKGENLAERPHRLARILYAPDEVEIVSRQLLDSWQRLAPPEPPAPTHSRSRLDIDRFISDHLHVHHAGAWNGGRKWVLSVCPFNQEHTDRSAVVIEHASGAVSFTCHHNGCTGNDWTKLREKIDPRWKRESNSGAGSSNGSTRPSPPMADLVRIAPGAGLLTQTCPELMAKVFPPAQFIVPGVLPEGATLLAGKAKKGKSWWALGVSLASAFGGVALGKLSVPQHGVLYFDLEGGEELLQERIGILLEGAAPPSNWHYLVESPRMDMDGVGLLDLWLEEHPDVHFVVIDVLKRVRKQQRGRNAYDEDYEALEDLVDLTHRRRIAMLILHHLKKEPSEDDPFDEISGTMGLQAVPDTLLVLRGSRGQADAILHMTGRRLKDDAALALSFDKDGGVWLLLGEAEEVALSKERQDVLDVLEENGALQPHEIAAVLGKNPVAIRVLLHKMVKDGDIDSPINGRYLHPGNAKRVKVGNTGNTPLDLASSSQKDRYRGVTGRYQEGTAPVTLGNTPVTPNLASSSQIQAGVTGVTDFSGVTADQELPHLLEDPESDGGRPF